MIIVRGSNADSKLKQNDNLIDFCFEKHCQKENLFVTQIMVYFGVCIIHRWNEIIV